MSQRNECDVSGFDERNIDISVVISACKSLCRDPLQNSFASEMWALPTGGKTLRQMHATSYVNLRL